jgi:hypothetical protein
MVEFGRNHSPVLDAPDFSEIVFAISTDEEQFRIFLLHRIT